LRNVILFVLAVKFSIYIVIITLALKRSNRELFMGELRKYIARCKVVPVELQSAVMTVLQSKQDIPDRVVYDRQFCNKFITDAVPVH
jgi:folate-binding Fe-S cluster repair protein YgfZ